MINLQIKYSELAHTSQTLVSGTIVSVATSMAQHEHITDVLEVKGYALSLLYNTIMIQGFKKESLL